MADVLQFVGRMWDGGAERLVVEYAKLLNKDSISTKIVTIYKINGTANSGRVIQNGIEEVSIFEKRTFLTRALKTFLGRIIIPLKLLKIIEAERPKVIHIHLQLLQYICPIRKHLKGIRLFYTCHSEPSCAFSGQNKKQFIAAKKLITDNMQMIALHDKMADELNKMFGIDSTVIIRNGIDFNLYKQMEVNSFAKKESVGISADSFLVGHIGRFSEPKNHQFIVDIFNCIQEKNKYAHLLLIGDGPLKSDVIQKIQRLGIGDKVTILSNRQDIPELLSCMDVFLFPSLYEGLSVTMIEAQVVGLNCVVSDTINNQTFITPNIAVLSLSSPAEQWADAALNFTGNISHWGNMDTFDLNVEIRRLEYLYLGMPRSR